MVLQLEETITIESLRNHAAETVEKLRELVAAGAPVNLDPRREGYYELEHECEVFYIHVNPDRSKVLLLATWHKDCPQAT